MKLNEAARSVTTNIQTAPEQFQIAATPQAFKILSANLYSNRILAIIRELICNAVDAHVAAGKPDEPIRVHLPNSLDPEFRVSDDGVGMSYETVLTLYRTYFGSDKNHTNELIGGLGLGSKSPFSYTDQFTVRSRYNKQLRVYQAYIGKDGTPAIMQVGDTAITDEQNGVEIVVPVKQADFVEFQETYTKFARFMPVRPKCDQVTIEEYAPVSEVHENEAVFRMYEHTRSDWGSVRIRMGIVTYSLGDSDLSSDIARSGVLEVPIGSVDISPNRETLSPTQKQKAWLKSIYNGVRKQMAENAIQIIADQKTIWDAMSMQYMYRQLNVLSGRDAEWTHPVTDDIYKLDGWNALPEKFTKPADLHIRVVQCGRWGAKNTTSSGWRNSTLPPHKVYWKAKRVPFIGQAETATDRNSWVLFGPAESRDEFLELVQIDEWEELSDAPKQSRTRSTNRKTSTDDDDGDDFVDTGFRYAQVPDNLQSWVTVGERARFSITELLDWMAADENNKLVMAGAIEHNYAFFEVTHYLKQSTAMSVRTLYVPASHKKVRARLLKKGAHESRGAFLDKYLTEDLLDELLVRAHFWTLHSSSDTPYQHHILREVSSEADDPDIKAFYEIYQRAIKKYPCNQSMTGLRYALENLGYSYPESLPVDDIELEAKTLIDSYVELMETIAGRYPGVIQYEHSINRKAINLFYLNHKYQEN